MIPRNPLSDMTDVQRAEKYISDIQKNDYILAYSEDNSKRPLVNTDVNKVEFIGGLWRIQRDFPYEIKQVHDQKFVIGDKINRSDLPKEELPIYDYYRAAKFWTNCYGLSLGNFDHVIVRSKNGIAYGKDIATARSKLSGKGMDKLIKNPFTRCIVVWMFSRMK